MLLLTRFIVGRVAASFAREVHFFFGQPGFYFMNITIKAKPFALRCWTFQALIFTIITVTEMYKVDIS